MPICIHVHWQTCMGIYVYMYVHKYTYHTYICMDESKYAFMYVYVYMLYKCLHLGMYIEDYTSVLCAVHAGMHI